jgi:hypothetical protein
MCRPVIVFFSVFGGIMEQREVHGANEIQLVDLLMIMVRRYRLIVCGALLFGVIGLVASVLVPVKYEFSTVVQIGHANVVDSASNGLLFEAPEVVMAKSNGVYIPLERRQLAQTDLVVPGVHVTNPKKSDLIVLSSKATLEQHSLVEKLHQGIVDQIVSGHHEIYQRGLLQLESAVTRARLAFEELNDPLSADLLEKASQASLNIEKNQLSRLGEEKQQLDMKLQGLNEKKTRLQQKADELRVSVEQMMVNRNEIASQPPSDSRAITLVMLDERVFRDRDMARDVEKALLFDLEGERNHLQQQVAANLRAQDQRRQNIEALQNTYLKDLADRKRELANQQQQLDELQERMSLYQGTEAVSLAVQSAQPASLRKAGLIGGMIVAGLFLFTCLAWMLELLPNLLCSDLLSQRRLSSQGVREV